MHALHFVLLHTCWKLDTRVNFSIGLCYSSGLGAQTNITHLLKAGDHVICFDDVYGGTNRYFRLCAANFGIEITFVDARDVASVQGAIQSNTKLLWMETPTNPMMKLIDIKAISDITRKYAPQAILVVDNTFMSPCYQSPLKLGADIVMHSVSKYINGK